MKTLKLLTMTALVSGTIALSTPAHAETSWFENMTQTVTNWFAPETTTTATTQTETYVDQVTIAVPPMTADDAANIQPAAGDYQPSLEDALENNVPGSIAVEDEQSFNTGFTNDSGSIAAFEDGITAEDLAGIETAAGDAEEITDEAIVVADDAMETMTEQATEMTETATEGAAETVERITPQPLNVAETAEDMTETTTETVAETTETMTEQVTETIEQAMDKAEEMAKDAIEPATGDATDNAIDAAKDAMPSY